MSDHSHELGGSPPRLGLIRIGVGLTAGVAVWALQESAEQKVWPATLPPLLGALAMVALLIPFVLVGGVGALRGRTLAIWSAAVAMIYAALGWHDMTRGVFEPQNPWPSPPLMAFGAAGLFIAHHLVAGADAERRVIARYPRYFEIAWKHGVQLALSAAFCGVFWIILFLGGALFNLIGIEAVNELIQKEWFGIPATATMFAAAVHLTDVRSSLIRGIRTVALTLLSWLLPILTLLGAAFLLTLPFTGLEPLWKTRSAAAILLSSAAVLIILINAAYQDGEPDGIVPLVLRLTTRLAAALLAPLVILAAYALWLRVGQHGLTPDRVVGVACAVAGAVYAVGYLAAAVRPGRWMRWLEPSNVTAAFVALALLLAIFTPLADPARLSVDNQMARLASGRVTADKFDYSFLRWETGRYGREALDDLVRRGGDAGKRAAAAKAEKERRYGPDERLFRETDLEVTWPKGRALPAGFMQQGWDRMERNACTQGDGCRVLLADLTRDGVEEVVVSNGHQVWVHGLAAGRWRLVGARYSDRTRRGDFDSVDEALRAGRVEIRPAPFDEIVVDGKAITIAPAASAKDDENAVEAEGRPGR